MDVPMEPTEEIGSELSVEGRFDLHVHPAPDLTPRHYDDLQLAEAGVRVGVRGIMLKAHHGSTEARAYLCNRWLADKHPTSDLAIFGGVVLNADVGGINPRRVETVLELGGKEVWLPTIDAANDRAHQHKSLDGSVAVLDASGSLAPGMAEVLSLVREHDAILATGHISAAESDVIVRAAHAAGIRHIVVTHPEFWIVDMPLDEQRALARDCGAIMERVFRQPMPGHGWPCNLARNLAAIREVGPESTMVCTDSGQTYTQPWEQALSLSVNYYYEHGVSEADIDHMTKDVPARLLGLA